MSPGMNIKSNIIKITIAFLIFVQHTARIVFE